MRGKHIFVLGFLILTSLAFAEANATTLTVDCSHPPTATRLASIGGALKVLAGPLGLLGPNTINVSGACNENIAIDGMINLTLTAQPGASITDASGGAQAAINVTRSTNFALNNFAVRGGGGIFSTGIACTTNSTCYLSSNDIQNPSGTGIVGAIGAAVSLDHDVVERSVAGLILVDASRGELLTATIRNNTGPGVVASTHSFLVTNFSTTIANNGGIGVFLADHSSAQITATSVSANAGVGVFAQSGSEVLFYPPLSTISGNANGVAVQDLSWANFLNAAVTVSGSTNQPDIQCWGHFSGAAGAAAAGPTNCPP